MRDADKEKESEDSEQDALGAFYIIGKQPHESMSGWIALEERVDEFLEMIFEEMEYTLQVEVKDQNMYDLYFVDTSKNNTLNPVPDQKAFEYVREQEKILVMVLHKEVDTSVVVSHPRYQDWLEENDV
ncbi:MAG: hypothetical protein P1Q69_17770 [Candidatus Thorarchaeota archaeon]|nr:hypothetical protein [Candidatus Thorarchaeota archaeon]